VALAPTKSSYGSSAKIIRCVDFFRHSKDGAAWSAILCLPAVQGMVNNRADEVGRATTRMSKYSEKSFKVVKQMQP
jgi:hypothetical protein